MKTNPTKNNQNVYFVCVGLVCSLTFQTKKFIDEKTELKILDIVYILLLCDICCVYTLIRRDNVVSMMQIFTFKICITKKAVDYLKIHFDQNCIRNQFI